MLGTKVTQILLRLSKINLMLQSREIDHIQSAEALIIALTQDPNIILIKLAEILQKMRIIDTLAYNEQVKTASQTEYIYIPIAHRLGLNTIKAELEDLHLKYTHKRAYRAIQRQFKSSREERERFIQRFKRPIEELLQQKNFPFIITARTKSVTSLRNKMKELDLFFQQVYDIFAIRIILDVPRYREKQACWQAYDIVTSLYKPHSIKFRNWVSYPRSNGYQALHTTVMSHEGEWVEVQIRTRRMDEIAEKGHAAHWRYKKVNNIEYRPDLDTWLEQIRSSLEQKSRKPEELIGTIDTSLQIDKIEIFSDSQRQRLSSIDSTVLDLDLTFELGTSLGLRYTGGQVNNKAANYHYTLNHDGDQIKIIRTSKQQARENWIGLLVKNKAHNAIKKSLQQKKGRNIVIWKKLVQKQLKKFHLKWSSRINKLLLILFNKKKKGNFYKKLEED